MPYGSGGVGLEELTVLILSSLRHLYYLIIIGAGLNRQRDSTSIIEFAGGQLRIVQVVDIRLSNRALVEFRGRKAVVYQVSRFGLRFATRILMTQRLTVRAGTISHRTKLQRKSLRMLTSDVGARETTSNACTMSERLLIRTYTMSGARVVSFEFAN